MKRQSAMDYLMTYGWAILIVIVVVCVLYSLDIICQEICDMANLTYLKHDYRGSCVCMVVDECYRTNETLYCKVTGVI